MAVDKMNIEAKRYSQIILGRVEQAFDLSKPCLQCFHCASECRPSLETNQCRNGLD